MRALTFLRFVVQSIRRQVQNFRTSRHAIWPAVAAIAAILLFVSAAGAQQDDKPKIPGLDKIISANEHLAFTGTVKSVDEKHNIISIDSVEGGTTEIFPIKHSTHVLTSDGYRKRLDVLSPGTHVIVYYDQRADHRSVTSIELYTSESKKKEPHS